MRELTVIKISKISIVKGPANRKGWVMKKSEDGNGTGTDDDIKAAIADIFGSDFDFEKADKETLLAALKTISGYKDILPDDMQEAIAHLAVNATGIEIEKEEEPISTDENPYPSMPDIRPSYMIKKSDEEEDPELEEDDEDNYDPVISRLNKIEKKLDGKKDDEDPWPSLDPVVPPGKVEVKKSQPIIKKEVGGKRLAVSTLAVSKQIRNVNDDEGNLDIKKKDDEEDLYPSLPDSLFELN